MSPEEHKRLRHHSSRLGWNQGEIIRQALHERLNQLDEQESFARANLEASKKTRGTKIGHVPLPRDDGETSAFKPPSLPEGFATKERDNDPVPRKFQHDYDRWLNFICAAEGEIEKSIRIQQVIDSIRERGGTVEQCDLILAQLKGRLEKRSSVMPSKIVAAPEGMPITGDVD